ncbi:MAG TPA: hypothetical protein VFB25_00905 [Gaiellaceae bacterium]|nr:hypothetical protein [Gaiellaceae bacterium]
MILGEGGPVRRYAIAAAIERDPRFTLAATLVSYWQVERRLTVEAPADVFFLSNSFGAPDEIDHCIELANRRGTRTFVYGGMLSGPAIHRLLQAGAAGYVDSVETAAGCVHALAECCTANFVPAVSLRLVPGATRAAEMG